MINPEACTQSNCRNESHEHEYEYDEYEHDSHNWWIKWKWLQYIDFKDYEKLESILPANRENAIDQCISEVTTLQGLAFEKVSTIVKKYS